MIVPVVVAVVLVLWLLLRVRRRRIHAGSVEALTDALSATRRSDRSRWRVGSEWY